ncbi:AMP-binding protein [Rhizobium sp. ARZ01]|uniref:phenylacetate--CoA ligase family protein n=1 Tax=Rhizobium sp. ARZ01 TaxID=2769313 RepID=UPI0017806619|nr:AMP-binding protein [Rhizobium sp. ARZ01]MBD9371044.1 AMP-binding protein [Rhizobium sp. ARZ01]
MTEPYDALETRAPALREAALFASLPETLKRAVLAPAYAERLRGFDLDKITDREALATLPVLRKAELPTLQGAALPFGGLILNSPGSFARLFRSPGPIFEPEADVPDPWRAARGLYAAGLRRGDVMLNTFSYHLTPGGFIMDSGARALGCAVIPAGPGNTEQQLELIEAYRPIAYCGAPDFLKILLDAADSNGRDITSIRKAALSGAAFPASLRKELSDRGILSCEIYATADAGVIAYQTPSSEGMTVNEDIILEIVHPGTGIPVPAGDVGEIVVTTLNAVNPIIRLALGDLSRVIPGESTSFRTNMRIGGWMGRADQAAKIKGMFVRPEQIAQIGQRHPELARLRLLVTRKNNADCMTLYAETHTQSEQFSEVIGATLYNVTKLKGMVSLVSVGSLPNDGKVIEDQRTYA